MYCNHLCIVVSGQRVVVWITVRQLVQWSSGDLMKSVGKFTVRGRILIYRVSTHLPLSARWELLGQIPLHHYQSKPRLWRRLGSVWIVDSCSSSQMFSTHCLMPLYLCWVHHATFIHTHTDIYICVCVLREYAPFLIHSQNILNNILNFWTQINIS